MKMHREKPKKNMRGGFTLVELLIVTVVILALMGVMFRLTGIAGGANARETTVYRMQCLENCLSGYYAAFGSYPPVPLQGGSRNIFRRTDPESTWTQSDNPNDTDESDNTFNEFHGVRAACRSQPLAVRFPPPSSIGGKESIALYKAYQQAAQNALSDGAFSGDDAARVEKWVNRSIDDISGSPGFLKPFHGETSANRLQLFRYGVMSFLLPRYMFMLDCAAGSDGANGTEAFNNTIDEFSQWTEFNTLPPRMDSGVSYESWKAFCNLIGGNDNWQIGMIPSQAACARWLPNLRDIVSGPRKNFFGIPIGTSGYSGVPRLSDAPSFQLYFPGGYNNASDSRGYPLLEYTVKDGWGEEFYYYSPAPYQTYSLWSSGPDQKTFPPWIDLAQFRQDHNNKYQKAMQWIADDITHMSTGK